MGIFSFFSKDVDEEEDEDYLDEEETPRRPAARTASISQLYEGMRLDVFKDSKPLLSGQVTKCSDSEVALSRLPGALSFKISPLGADVSLRGYDKMLIPINLTGSVAESTRTCFKVKDLKIQSHDEVRETFRLPYSAPVSIYRGDDDHFRNPEEGTLVDISTSGCGIESEYIHMEDEVVRIRIKLEEYAPLNFLGQIVRCSDSEQGKFRYGVLFAQLTEQEITTLNKTLYNLQMGVRDTHMRKGPGEPGHW